MLPRIGSSKLISTWILVTLGASIVALLDGGFLYAHLGLAPARIWHGEVWRIVTWPLIELGPTRLIVTCVSIYYFGGQLAPRWGDRRLRRYMLQIVVAGGIAASLGALISDEGWQMFRAGGYAVSDALVIAWARQYPTSALRLYGVLELHGRQLIAFTVGVTILLAIATSPFVMLPELVACLGAAYYPTRWLAR